MGIDLLIKIFILFFIKIVNLLLHYAMEDRPVKEKINDESIKKKGGISQVSNQMKSQICIHEDMSGLCSSRGRWPLAPNFCPRATRKSQIFHTNHMLGTLDFTDSEDWAPFNFP